MSRPYRLGLTGSVGMGKSTTARLFAEGGVPVWDADAAVHRLYAAGGAGAAVIAGLAPAAVAGDAVDRDRLRDAIIADPGLLARIEAGIHPLVAADREAFAAARPDADVIVFDIPLLFETMAERDLDGILVVSAAADVQRARVLERPGMTPEALERILARQMPDAEKRARADFVIATDRGIEAARADVLALLARIRAGGSHA
ncbi:MAG TPA: dephospho-CoA kinase [Amaricoccus sp.]|nr:dephospho-CoA kinase [Amaricoccus sp.]